MQVEQQSKQELRNHETLLRQWELLRIIPRFPTKISVSDLVNRLRASSFVAYDRKVQRDLNILSECFPIEADKRNKPYGWFWPEGVHMMDVPGMDSHTALAFWLAEQHLKPLLPHATFQKLQGYFKTAANVLNRTNTNRGAIAWPKKVRVLQRGPKRIAPSIQSDVQNEIYDALLLNRRLNITYQSSKQRAEYDEINPLALVIKNGVTYLICSTRDYSDLSQLALHRVLKAKLLDIPSTTPDGFNIDENIASGDLNFPVGGTIKIKALISKKMAFHLDERPLSDDQRIEEQENEALLLTATVQDTNELRLWLLGFGDQVEVLEPVELRDYFTQITAKMANTYAP